MVVTISFSLLWHKYLLVDAKNIKIKFIKPPYLNQCHKQTVYNYLLAILVSLSYQLATNETNSRYIFIVSQNMELLKVSEDEKQKVREFYETDEARIKQDLEIIKEWYKKRPHLPQGLNSKCLLNVVWQEFYHLLVLLLPLQEEYF